MTQANTPSSPQSAYFIDDHSEDAIVRRTLAAIVDNEPGVLARVVGLFSARGYNIESLTVAATDNPSVSRLTVVTLGTEDVVNQINKQVSKLIDVVDRVELTRRGHIEREVLLLKLTDVAETYDSWLQAAGAREIDNTDDMRVVELFATGELVDDFIVEADQQATVVEVVRSGVAAIASGDQVLALKTTVGE